MIGDHAGNQKETGHHEGVVDNMKNGTLQGRGVGNADAADDIPDLGDDDIGEHAFVVALGQGHDGTE